MGLILGLDAAGATRRAIVGALLIVAVADNLSDSLSVHIYQEAERLKKGDAFVSTATNFAARLVVALTFVAWVLVLPIGLAPAAAIAWGLVLLALLTDRIARAKGVPIVKEIGKHIAVAGAVLVVSRVLGTWIAGSFG